MKKNLGMLIYENVQPIDFMGPWEVLSFWVNVLKAPVNMYLVSESGSYVQCDNNIIVKAHKDFDNCPQLDYLMIAGGHGRVAQVENEKIISFIKKQAKQAEYVISICTGMFLLHKAGLLQGKFATTYWRALPELRSFDDVINHERRVIKNGKVWTCAGISSGMDMAFEFIAEVAGREVAGQVQLLFEYFPRDDIYCSVHDSVKALPPYYGSVGVNQPYLPQYIKEYNQSKK